MEAFNLKYALNGSPVQTRDGRKVSKVRVVCANIKAKYQQGLMAEIHNKCGLCDYTFYSDGGSHAHFVESGADLMMVSEQVN